MEQPFNITTIIVLIKTSLDVPYYWYATNLIFLAKWFSLLKIVKKLFKLWLRANNGSIETSTWQSNEEIKQVVLRANHE